MKHVILAALVSAAALGCSGAIEGNASDQPPGGGATGGRPRGGGAGGTSVTGATNGGSASGDPESVGRLPLRRLTRTEYNNTVRDLLGDRTHPADGFPVDARVEAGFFDPLAVSGVETSRYRDAAEALAATAVTDAWAQLAPCAAGKTEEVCATELVERFGRRAFRRALDAQEKDDLVALYKTVRAAPISGDHKAGVQAVVTAMLQAPQFLYHWELGTAAPQVEGDVVKLTPFELAARLSYLVWQSMPDDALLDAAATGKLDSEAEIDRQARRLLGDARASDAVASFYDQLFETEKLPTLTKDTKVYPAFTSALADSMGAELRAFVSDAVLGDGGFDALMSSPVAFVDAPLAQLYGVTGVSGPRRRVDVDATQRSGLLTRAAFLAVAANVYETSPVLRGKLVLNRLLCRSVAPPPADVVTMIPPAKAGQQTREKFESHEASPSCAACHKMMDPLGFALEAHDGIGRYRTTDAGRAVNTTGTVTLDDRAVPFANARDLSAALAASTDAHTCLARQLLRFAGGRNEEDDEAASLASALAAFTAAKRDVRELIVAIAKSRTFTHRAVVPGEVLR